jgi:hypothetical protein
MNKEWWKTIIKEPCPFCDTFFEEDGIKRIIISLPSKDTSTKNPIHAGLFHSHWSTLFVWRIVGIIFH